MAYMSSQSILAIEYVHILNSNNDAPECGKKPPTPPPKPDVSRSLETWWWVILALCLSIILVLIILIGIYCILEHRHTRSHDCTNK